MLRASAHTLEELALAGENVRFGSSSMKHGSQGGHCGHSGLVIPANSNIRHEKKEIIFRQMQEFKVRILDIIMGTF